MNRRIMSYYLSLVLLITTFNFAKANEVKADSSEYIINMKRDILSIMMGYPDYVKDIKVKDGNVYLIMKSGNSIVYDDKKDKSEEGILECADIHDSLKQVYPLGKISSAMERNFNPGRARCYKLLNEIYGSSQAEIEKQIKYIGNNGFSKSNNAVSSLESALSQINLASKSNSKIGANVYPTAGAYNYRYVRGTGRLSAHAYGIAIDLKTNGSDYWKWANKEAASKRIENYPEELYKIFEDNNFIWGGKWGYFDIMHYEYRPEIIYKAKYFPVTNECKDDKNWFVGAPEDDTTKACIDFINSKLQDYCSNQKESNAESYRLNNVNNIRVLSQKKEEDKGNIEIKEEEKSLKADEKSKDTKEEEAKKKKEDEENKKRIIEETKEEAVEFIKNLFIARNKAIIAQDLSMVNEFYNKGTKYGLWAYEYEERKMKYIKDWSEKQGAVFTEITPEVLIRKVSGDEKYVSINLSCSTNYKYYYIGDEENINSCRIGTYHVIKMMKNDGKWIILKEWYKDPFGDSLDTKKLKSDSIREYILSQEPRDFSDINERRKKCVEYGFEYSGAGNDEGTGFNYNKKYKNYNSEGGDCADFASQMLHEGGGFKMNSAWNVDKKGATRSWVNADGFKDYMIYSGRAYVIAYGKYDKVYKSAYKLLPGDFVAYEKKGDVIHISMVTGADSKGYPLVTCHNTDRKQVPWDLGFSNSNIKFYLVRVCY